MDAMNNTGLWCKEQTHGCDAMNNVGLWMWWTTHRCEHWMLKGHLKERMKYANSRSNHSKMSKNDK